MLKHLSASLGESQRVVTERALRLLWAVTEGRSQEADKATRPTK